MNVQGSVISLTFLSAREQYTVGVLLTALLISLLVILTPHERVQPRTGVASPPSPPGLAAAVPATTAAVKARVSQLPLYFIENQGQSDEQVAYYLQGRDTSMYFTADGLTLALQEPAPVAEKEAVQPLHRLARPEPATAEPARQRWAVKVQFVGAEPVKPQGRAKTAAVVSYFKGPQANWKTGLSTYTEVAYPNVWPGIEVVYSGDGGHLKTTFHVQPGADPRQIQLAYQGATNVTLTDAGRLAVQTPVGGFEEDRPLVYQEIDGQRTPVEARYTLVQTETGEWRYGFALGDYDASRPLVIDPVILVYCGYIGGSDYDYGRGIAVDGSGQVYVVGETSSTDSFPVRGGPDLTGNSYYTPDAFVAKVSADGTQLVYAGYIGGSSGDYGTGIAVDGAGQAYVVGYTYSTQASFPVRGGPDLTYNGGPDAFVAKVSADGTQLVYAGYLGGSSDDYGHGIAVDSLGQAYVVGETDSTEASFPVRGGPDLTYNGGLNDAFVAKVSADGTHLVYAGYLGGSGDDYGHGIAVDGSGQAYVVGETDSTEASFPVRGGPDLTYNGGEYDAFVAKVSADGTQLVYAGYLGGGGTVISGDYGYGIAVDGSGQAYVVGKTNSSDFPVRGGPDLTYNGGYDAFVAKVSADGTQLVYAGYLGGDSDDSGYGIAVDGSGQAYVVGHTNSTEASFPVRGGPDLTYNGGYYGDAFVAKVSADGTQLMYAGYLGGGGRLSGDYGYGIAVDGLGQAYVVGYTESTEATFPVRGGPDLTFNGGGDAFVAKVADTDLAPPGKAVLIAPTGPITTTTPTYQWQAVAGATWYYLWVNDASGNRIKQWYTAAQVGCESGSSECTVTPTVALQPGAGQWWVQTYGASGYGPWSDGLSFTLKITPPSAPVLIAPTGTITPTYRWQAVPNATWYYLWVNDASGNRIKQWYTAAQVGCASGNSECAITLAVSLQGGTGQCWVQSYSASGYGSWNSGCRIDYVTPTYRWRAVTGATWYYLWVNDASGNRIKQWYTAAQVGCAGGSGECTVTPTVTLQPGAGQWWVQAYGATGYGPWSQGMTFMLQ